MRSFIPVIAVVLGTLSAYAQEPGAPRKPIELFKDVRDLVNDGRYELAAETLREFATLKPTDQDYLDIEAKFGTTSFLKLRNIPRWYDDQKKDAEFRERLDAKKPDSKNGVLETIITESLKANEKLTRDPKRIQRYVRNLAATPEEREFAILELRRGGDAVVPVLVESFRLDRIPEQEAGLQYAVRELNAVVVPGLLAAVEGLADETKGSILRSIAARRDVTSLVTKMDTDFTPLLWYYATGSGALQNTAQEILRNLSGGVSDRRDPVSELVRIGQVAFDRKARFAGIDNDPQGAKVKLWQWDANKQNVESSVVSPGVAEERYGLKYLRYAVERKPSYEPASDLFLALAIERAVERANYIPLLKSAPHVAKLIATVPATTLSNLLEKALVEQRTPLAFGLTSALGERVERSAAIPQSKNTPALLVRAMNYPDPRVQLAGAMALLKIPGPPQHGATARVVDILRRAAGDAT
ncbi:MAG: hypothetical protein ACRCZF_21970, partial [Gemmataceae bacterium]